MRQKQHYLPKFSSKNDLNRIAEQVLGRTIYEYKSALNQYAMLYRLEDDTADALLKIYLLGRIMDRTPNEIDNDIVDSIDGR